jgi:hypothetical protein
MLRFDATALGLVDTSEPSAGLRISVASNKEDSPCQQTDLTAR